MMNKSLAKSLIRIALGVALSLLTAEAVSRRIFSFKLAFDNQLQEFVFAPGGWVRYRLEGDGLSKWTVHGVRRAEMPSDSNVSSILVLGDSFTEALQVSDGEVYSARLERELQEIGMSHPVLNLGKASCSVADYIGLAVRNNRLFNPIWTVIQVQESDFTTDAWNSKKVNRSTAYFYRDPASGRLEIAGPQHVELAKRGWLRDFTMKMRNESAFVQFAFQRVEELQLWVEHEPALFTAGGPTGEAPHSETWHDFPIKEELERLAASYSGRITLLLLSECNPALGRRPSEFEKHLIQIADEMGIGVVALSAQYPSLLAKGESPFGFSNGIFNKGHMNPLGHALAANELAEELVRVFTENGIH
jgi:hypothetical protein